METERTAKLAYEARRLQLDLELLATTARYGGAHSPTAASRIARLAEQAKCRAIRRTCRWLFSPA